MCESIRVTQKCPGVGEHRTSLMTKNEDRSCKILNIDVDHLNYCLLLPISCLSLGTSQDHPLLHFGPIVIYLHFFLFIGITAGGNISSPLSVLDIWFICHSVLYGCILANHSCRCMNSHTSCFKIHGMNLTSLLAMWKVVGLCACGWCLFKWVNTRKTGVNHCHRIDSSKLNMLNKQWNRENTSHGLHKLRQ